MSTTIDLGPLLAAVTDEEERGLTIAGRAGIDSRTAGPRLAALEREGLVSSRWTDKYGGVKLYRRGPKAPPLQRPDPVTEEMVEAGRVAINEIPAYVLQHASEGKPYAEEIIARAVLAAALGGSQ